MLVSALLAVPVVSFIVHANPDSPADAVMASALLTYALVLCASVVVYVHWRIVHVGKQHTYDTRLSAWLTLGLSLAAINGLVQSAPVDLTTGLAVNRWPLVSQIVVLVILILVALIAERVDIRRDPAFLGMAGGVAIFLAYVAAIDFAPPLIAATPLVALLNTVEMLTGLVLALVILQCTAVALWVRRRLAFSAIVLTGAQCASNDPGVHQVLSVVAIAANLVGAVTLCMMTVRLLRDSVMEQQRALQEAQASVRQDHELLHELGSTLAGITSASQLMRRGGATLSAQRRSRLEQMVEAELDRAQRLMLDRSPCRVVPVEVEDVLDQLVLSHQARGLDVRWTPGDAPLAAGDPDELAEVVNILLDNAGRHAGSATVWLDVDCVDGFVQITCTDEGPGVAPEIGDRIFDSGVSGPDSRGSGLGLAIAQRFMAAAGGSLELVSTPGQGATFVARLPETSRRSHVARDHVA